MKEKIFIEINGAAGGEESSLFAKDLARMYIKYANRLGFSITEIKKDPIILECKGENVYSAFKNEGGVHRVQRVPATEKKGRVHTSTVTVSVRNKIEQNTIKIRQEDIEIMTSRSGGKGGQHVNRTESRVQIRHKPTGIIVVAQDERSQLKNKEIAMARLEKLLQEYQNNNDAAKYNAEKKEQVGTGDRSEKIRTYNQPQNYVADHRTGEKWKDYKGFLDGKYLDQIIIF